MARSEAQKSADKRYAEKIKGKHKQFAVNLKESEYNEIITAILDAGMTKADFLRWAFEKLKNSKNGNF